MNCSWVILGVSLAFVTRVTKNWLSFDYILFDILRNVRGCTTFLTIPLVITGEVTEMPENYSIPKMENLKMIV